MKMRRFGLLPAVAFLALAALAADDELVGARKAFVTVAPVSTITVATGGTGKAELRFRVLPGYHINSSRPRSELLVPTRLKLEPVTDLGIGKIQYPDGEDFSLPFAPDQKLSVYTGDFLVTADVLAVRTASPGIFKVHGELQYQACDDRSCYPPKTLPVAFEVRVVKGRRGR